jgi:hypothetical protein
MYICHQHGERLVNVMVKVGSMVKVKEIVLNLNDLVVNR